jgi:hypothetical protein
MSKSITAQFCRQNENGSSMIDVPLHTCSITEAYPLIKTAGQGLMVGFIYFSIAT